MQNALALVEAVVVLEALAVAAALAVGIVVAPVLVILHAGVEWKRRAKWIAVCMMTSWIGFWFWRRDIRREANRIA